MFASFWDQTLNQPVFFGAGAFLCVSYILVSLEITLGSRTMVMLKDWKPHRFKLDAGSNLTAETVYSSSHSESQANRSDNLSGHDSPSHKNDGLNGPLNWPLVSIIIPACNEADTLEAGLSSILACDYPALEIWVINDRSTDGTGELIETLKNRWQDPRLKTITIETLPTGWLGKNHALQVGAQQAQGEYLLFIDADVLMDPSTLRRALDYLTHKRLDHLVLMPQLIGSGWLLMALYGSIGIFFMARQKPWLARYAWAPFYMGVGAFNLIRASVYHTIGGHEAIRLCPDDDMRLGYLVKKSQYKQDVGWGTDLVKVPWYPTPATFIEGLMKNTFAFMNYSIPGVVCAIAAVGLFHLLPWVMVWVSHGLQQWLYGSALILIALVYWDQSRYCPRPWSTVLGFPLAASVLAYISATSACRTLRQQGIIWRGTHYPLAELKAFQRQLK